MEPVEETGILSINACTVEPSVAYLPSRSVINEDVEMLLVAPESVSDVPDPPTMLPVSTVIPPNVFIDTD